MTISFYMRILSYVHFHVNLSLGVLFATRYNRVGTPVDAITRTQIRLHRHSIKHTYIIRPVVFKINITSDTVIKRHCIKQTPRISPSFASYAVSVVIILEKVIMSNDGIVLYRIIRCLYHI